MHNSYVEIFPTRSNSWTEAHYPEHLLQDLQVSLSFSSLLTLPQSGDKPLNSTLSHSEFNFEMSTILKASAASFVLLSLGHTVHFLPLPKKTFSNEHQLIRISSRSPAGNGHPIKSLRISRVLDLGLVVLSVGTRYVYPRSFSFCSLSI